MATLLLIAIYVGYIGLGIPDSIFGTAWPIVRRELALPVSLSSFISMTTCACSIVSSLNSQRIIKRFGTGRVAAVSTLMTAVGLLGFALSPSAVWFFVCCIPLGLGAGAVDAGLNNYVALHYNARVMSFLHGFYGVGITLSPLLLSYTLRDENWRGGYFTTFAVQMVIFLILLLSLPIWKRVEQLNMLDAKSEDAVVSESLSFVRVIKIPGVKSVMLTFICSCALESLCTSWATSYLVDEKGMTGDRAALAVTFYYIGLTLGRLISGIASAFTDSHTIIKIGKYVIGASVGLIAVSLFDFASSGIVAAVGLFLVGLGNGPTYPNLMYLTPRSFGVERSQAVMGAQNAVVYVGIMLLPPLFGLTVQTLGAVVFPGFMLIGFFGMLAAHAAHLKAVKKSGRE